MLAWIGIINMPAMQGQSRILRPVSVIIEGFFGNIMYTLWEHIHIYIHMNAYIMIHMYT